MTEEWIQNAVAIYMVLSLNVKTAHAVGRIGKTKDADKKATEFGRLVGIWIMNVAVAFILYHGGFWNYG